MNKPDLEDTRQEEVQRYRKELAVRFASRGLMELVWELGKAVFEATFDSSNRDPQAGLTPEQKAEIDEEYLQRAAERAVVIFDAPTKLANVWEPFDDDEKAARQVRFMRSVIDEAMLLAGE